MTLPDRDAWQRLSPLLDELLDLDAGARASRLAALRSQDAALADELAILLDEGERAEAERFLSGDLLAAIASPSLEGQRVGAYVLESLLGQGSTGSVWRAHRADGRFDGSVAIKLLHLSLIGHAAALRFEQEGAILARLTHPHIARLLDAGVTPGGQPYLVLDLVEGETIDRYCDSRRLSVEQRLVLFDDVLAAMAHAHSHLVVHRDIKPSNILVDAEGRVKLLDFGIARLLEEGVEGATLTAAGQRALTPQYAAPEQLLGAAVTTATDIYALGVLLYRLLCGRHPTPSASTRSADVIRATLDSDPVPLADAVSASADATDADIAGIAAERDTSPQRLRHQLRGDLENIVARTLRKAPHGRYQTVEALADDLQRHRRHQPVSARADSPAYRVAKFVRRHRGMVAGSVLVLLAVAGGLAGTVTQAHRAERERDHALRELRNAKSSSEFVAFLLQEGSDKPFTTAQLLERGEQMVERQFADAPEQRARLRLMLAGVYGQAMIQNQAERLLLNAQADAAKLPDPALQVEIECQLAMQRGDSGALEVARRMLDAAIARLRAMPDADSSLLATCLHGRGQVVDELGDPKASLADVRAALDLIGTPRPDQRLDAIMMRASMASLQSRLGESAAAEAQYRGGIAELEAMGRGRTEVASTMYNNLGVLLADAGQTARASAALQRALALSRGLRDEDPVLEGNVARLLIDLGQPREAMPLIAHALAAAQARGSKRSIPGIALQGARGACLLNDLARCDSLLAQARAETLQSVAPGRSMHGSLEMALAEAALARGDGRAALDGLRRAVALFDAATDRDNTGIRALTLLARAEQRQGELDAAQSHAALAVTRAREALSGFAHSEWLGSALVALGRVQQARGDGAAAQVSWTTALEELQAAVGETAPATEEVRKLLAAR
ncbi:MAG TPA: serine/threonine-protein kinase [Albitalea sp.]|uniref:serine/threonine-protein kinase n=1 Tax=Piscinibacter sp. TaxID=1903157 RepID=UPI002ED58801